MIKENGDDYIRRTASFVRTHERRLADSAIGSRHRHQKTPMYPASVLGWFGLGPTEHASKPLLFTDDLHHLFYLLMRFENLGIDVGSLDVRVQNPSRPTSMSYLAMLALKDKSDVLSISSFRSTISSVSMFSLGGGWLGRAQPVSLDAELKYLYSAFTRLPALRVHASGLKIISELADDPPTDSAIPMDAFKCLQRLECDNIDPRTLMGWDQLSVGLKSLTVTRSGLEDVTDLLVDAVIDDKSRRDGNPARLSRRRLIHRPSSFRSRSSLHADQLPTAVPEESEPADEPASQDLSPGQQLPVHAWSRLAHLSLSDNNLTFLPSLPPLPNLYSLDLSSNLLISVPPSLSTLTSLRSLNLAQNMVDSVLGIYSQIPLIVSLNISSNRLDSLCGLERLEHLSRVDLRDNRVEDIDEFGRLAVLETMKEVWVSGNPCTRREQDWRVHCFDLFAKESRNIVLDGTTPGVLERRAMLYQAGKGGHSHSLNDNGRPLSHHHPPHVDGTSVASLHPLPQSQAVQDSAPSSPHRDSSAPLAMQNFASIRELGPQLKARRRKIKRIVDLDDKDSLDESCHPVRSPGKSHARHSSDVSDLRHDVRLTENIFVQSITNMSPPSEDAAARISSETQKSPEVSDAQSVMIADDPLSKSHSATVQPPAAVSRIRQGTDTARTLSSIKANKRRARISPSTYEPASPSQRSTEQGHELEQVAETSSGKLVASEADIFRKRIEALRSEVGDSWLKVLSQTHLNSLEKGNLS